MNYVVFGLGNSSYENFCGMGVKTDARLEYMGAKRLFNLGKGNALNETTEKDWEYWKASGLWEVLENNFPLFEIELEDYLL